MGGSEDFHGGRRLLVMKGIPPSGHSWRARKPSSAVSLCLKVHEPGPLMLKDSRQVDRDRDRDRNRWPFLCLFILCGSSPHRVMPMCIAVGDTLYPVPDSYASLFSETATDTPRNLAPPAAWASPGAIRLTAEVRHHCLCWAGQLCGRLSCSLQDV